MKNGLIYVIFGFLVLGCDLSKLMDKSESSKLKGELETAGLTESTPVCGFKDIEKPVDVTEFNNGIKCLHGSFSDLKELVNYKKEELDKLKGFIILNNNCMDFDEPKNLEFIAGAVLEGGDSGSSFNNDFRLPFPAEVKKSNLLSKILNKGITFFNKTIKDGTTLVVGKLVEFKEERYLKLVNIATVKTSGGKKYLETLTSVAKEYMSDSMGISGDGVYGIYLTTKPVGFISGEVISKGKKADNALITGTSAPFLSYTDKKGSFSIFNMTGQTTLSAFDLNSGADGQLSLATEKGDTINPKTGKIAESPAKEKSIHDLDTLNLTGVTINLDEITSNYVEKNMDFELGTSEGWNTTGDALLLKDEITHLFPDTSETFYMFLSTGDKAEGGMLTKMTRTLKIPATANNLNIEYNVLSQEYPEWVGSPFNDIFTVLLAGSTSFMINETITSNKDLWKDYQKTIGNVDASSVSKTFNGETGRRIKKIDFSSCRGEEVRLIFTISDVGDAIYDTAALINRIWFD